MAQLLQAQEEAATYFASHILILEQNCYAKIDCKPIRIHFHSVLACVLDFQGQFSILTMMSKEEQQALKNLFRGTSFKIRYELTVEPKKVPSINMFFSREYSTNMADIFVNNVLKYTTFIQNPSTQKCSSPDLLTIGYF